MVVKPWQQQCKPVYYYAHAHVLLQGKQSTVAVKESIVAANNFPDSFFPFAGIITCILNEGVRKKTVFKVNMDIMIFSIFSES